MLAKNFAVSDAFETTSSCLFFVDDDVTSKRKFRLGRVVELAPRDPAAPNSSMDSDDEWRGALPPQARADGGSCLVRPNDEQGWLNYLLVDAVASPIVGADNIRGPSHFTSVTDRENECESDRGLSPWRNEGRGGGDDPRGARQFPDTEHVPALNDPTLLRLYRSQQRAAEMRKKELATTEATRRRARTETHAQPTLNALPKSERWANAEARVEQLIQSKCDERGVALSAAAAPKQDRHGDRQDLAAVAHVEMGPRRAPVPAVTGSPPPLPCGASLRDRWKKTSEHFRRIAAMTNTTLSSTHHPDHAEITDFNDDAPRYYAAAVMPLDTSSPSSLHIYEGYVSPLDALRHSTIR